jgi:hypothetical protein
MIHTFQPPRMPLMLPLHCLRFLRLATLGDGSVGRPDRRTLTLATRHHGIRDVFELPLGNLGRRFLGEPRCVFGFEGHIRLLRLSSGEEALPVLANVGQLQIRALVAIEVGNHMPLA